MISRPVVERTIPPDLRLLSRCRASGECPGEPSHSRPSRTLGRWRSRWWIALALWTAVTGVDGATVTAVTAVAPATATATTATATATATATPASAGLAAPAQIDGYGLDRRLDEQVMRLPYPGRPGIELETTVYRPEGPGPFPLLVINHGKSNGVPSAQPRAHYEWLTRVFLRRGWAVALPMRQGFAGSGGRHPPLVDCDFEALGRAQAEDVRAAITQLATEPWVDAGQIVVAGQSYGGLATLAYGVQPHRGVRALINFAGGVRHPGCANEVALARAMSIWGRSVRLPSLWFYGDNDSLWSPAAWQQMHAAWTQAGAEARLVAFGQFASGDAHDLLASAAGVRIWLPEVERLLRSLNLPTAPVRTLTGARLPNPVSAQPQLGDIDTLPGRGPKVRAAYRDFLAAEPPRAFVLGPGGVFAWAAGGRAPEQSALDGCRRLAINGCQLWAVDDQRLLLQPAPTANPAVPAAVPAAPAPAPAPAALHAFHPGLRGPAIP